MEEMSCTNCNATLTYEENDKVTFLYKIEEGPANKSYGINVARLANLPKEVTDRAEEILKIYERKEKLPFIAKK